MKTLAMAAMAALLASMLMLAEDKPAAKPTTALPTDSDRLAHMELVATYQNLEAVIQRGRADIAESQPRQQAVRERLETLAKALNQKAGCKLTPDLKACEEAKPEPVSSAPTPPAKPPTPTQAKAGK